MKKILFGILTFLGIGLSFCSAESIFWNALDSQPLYNSSFSQVADTTIFGIDTCNQGNYPAGVNSTLSDFNKMYVIFTGFDSDLYLNNICFSRWSSVSESNTNLYINDVLVSPLVYSGSSIVCYDFGENPINLKDSNYSFFYYFYGYSIQKYYLTTLCRLYSSVNNSSLKNYYFGLWSGTYFNLYYSGNDSVTRLISPYSFTLSLGGTSCPDPDPQEITIHYNNNQSSTTISCDGNPDVYINGLSTITSTNTFTPYFNISYKDEDNQSLIESYDKSILYLENAQFKKTYTGNNDWILTVQGGNNSNFSGYLPTFDVVFTGDSLDTGNIFNNFAENSLKFTLSNIPSYIQYVIIILILFFILGFIRKFKRK